MKAVSPVKELGIKATGEFSVVEEGSMLTRISSESSEPLVGSLGTPHSIGSSYNRHGREIGECS
jgi:hypothetical protein